MPMPTTHFLVGVLSIKVISYFGFSATFIDMILGGLIAMFIDLDHVIVYYRRHKNLDFLKSFHNAVFGIEEERSWIHEWTGLVFFIILSGATYFIAPHYAPIILASSMSHLILDYEHIRHVHRRFLKIAHFIYPISATELTMNAFVLLAIFIL